ncbi:HRDC domain-containing protein [Conexibacter sp. JD483]|uniref:ribonuclease D n=1 Tax=unclassified Conexibacter TaxID=2627773 RepID=UPI002716ABB0|nr:MULTISPECIES: HRDC domain-containing protein [unclassified Conexibacter]MDO8184141.1 HRDC domain-containing protein [Conexibacter sp. CPCC 205706]MDO8197133.1 HRDC domain-containing protein [Conexibacter sp. CPCC 205762]MDR9367552.1 HRDC domain-containing protein [Conexibacter sp. JD483]
MPQGTVTTLAGSDEVVRIAELASASGRLGIDTEFMSEGRYRALLCLVQVAVPDADSPDGVRIALFDPFEQIEFGPLAEVLADPAVEIVLHAARQDVAILRRAWQTEVTNVFDTQVAAGFAGYGAQTGYGNLLGAALGQRVGKTASYTRWDARPLTEEQVLYAREDVVYLLQLSDGLHEQLSDSGRLEWAREECRRMEGASDERDPDTAFERLPRSGQLDPRSRAVAKEVAAWRERTAQQEDKPVGSILPDPALVEIAKRKPASVRELEQIRGLHGGHLRRRGQAIVDAVDRGRDGEPIAREARRPGGEQGDAPLIAVVEAVIRARALEAGLAYELVASRAELEQIVIAARRGDPQPDVRALSGWRLELVGGELAELLAGRRAVTIADGRIAVSEAA